MRLYFNKIILASVISMVALAAIPFSNVSASTDKVAVYRFYHYSSGSHFYTTSQTERERVIRDMPGQYRYEGYKFAGWTSGNNASRVPVARFYNLKTRTHFYTVSPTETQRLRQTSGFRYEGVAYYGQRDFTATEDVDGQCPLVRFYNFRNGTHFYTTSYTEAYRITRTMDDRYRYEGLAYVVWDEYCNWF